MMIGALGSALQGMERASAGLDSVAANVASPDADLVSEMMQLEMSKVSMQASVAVARAADAMTGTLIDTFA